jgi:hypothetical protein
MSGRYLPSWDPFLEDDSEDEAEAPVQAHQGLGSRPSSSAGANHPRPRDGGMEGTSGRFAGAPSAPSSMPMEPRHEPPGSSRPPESSTLNFTIDLDREFRPPYRELWPYRYLNHVQSAVFSTALKTDSSIVVRIISLWYRFCLGASGQPESAVGGPQVAGPTGVGKTMIFELAIVRLLQESEMLNDRKREWKIVYIAPMKALCQQHLQVRLWRRNPA